jgi:hypothetical protein
MKIITFQLTETARLLCGKGLTLSPATVLY